MDDAHSELAACTQLFFPGIRGTFPSINKITYTHYLTDSKVLLNDFVTYDDKLIKWSDYLRNQVKYSKYIQFADKFCRKSIYRPFTKKFVYFHVLLNDARGLQHYFFPTSTSGNTVICITDVASEKPFMSLASDSIPDLHLVGAGAATQCFPFYTYAEDGSNRRENITDWALGQFQAKYGDEVTKWDIFYYVYGLLHHPVYRERYAENLKRDLPHIPLVGSQEAFEVCSAIGKALMELHLGYEGQKEYGLEWIENGAVPFSYRVQRMRLSADKSQLVVNESLTLRGIPQECFEYRLGNRSALEWVIDQYQVSVDKRSGIESDPNMYGDEDYIVRLVGRVVTVSVETVRLVRELADRVRVEEWVGRDERLS
jgi:predicted helicase